MSLPLASHHNPALASEQDALAGAGQTYLLSSTDFDSQFTAALEAEPAIELSTVDLESAADMQEPPIVAPATAPSQSSTTPVPPLVADGSAVESHELINELAPCNILDATLRALAAPFRSELARETLRMMPSWGGSMLVHMLAVLGLALYIHQESRAPAPRTLELALAEAPDIGQPEELRDDALESLPTVQPITIEAAESALPIADAGDVLVAPDLPVAMEPEISTTNLNHLLADPLKVGTKRGSPEAKTDKNGKGIIDLRENETAFFGIKGQGKKFCFIVDNSKSMTGARFRTAIAELVYSVEKLQADQVFYVCFFSDGAYPMFFPNIAREMIPATNENKAKFREWLRFVDLGPATYGSAAMKIGLDLEPDIMFLLGDGDFQDDTVREVLKRANPRTKVHTIGLDIAPRSRADAGFAAIARAFYGTYRNIRVVE